MDNLRTRCISTLLAALLAAVMVSLQNTYAAELLMLEQKGCAYCERFNREIAPAYPKTAEGKTAPLRRIDIDEPWPEDLSRIRPEKLTPTFILIEDNEELGRLHGYAGDEHFWFLLGELFDTMKSRTSGFSR